MGDFWEAFSGFSDLLLALLAVFVWMALKAFREAFPTQQDSKKEQSKSIGHDEDVKEDN